MNNINYQLLLEKIIEENQSRGKLPTLLLHACCAPCSSYPLEYLSKYFKITLFYYNPNITDEDEYNQRLNEAKRLVKEGEYENPVRFLEGSYDPKKFFEAAKGLENEPEGGKRCEKCFHLRLSQTAKIAAEQNFDYFSTTLTISPLKNAQLLNRIAKEEGELFHAQSLPSDFKKRGGYLRSIELSKKYNLYRQNYCGCIFSKRQREE